MPKTEALAVHQKISFQPNSNVFQFSITTAICSEQRPFMMKKDLEDIKKFAVLDAAKNNWKTLRENS